jgi:hypothetical protein
MLRFGPLTLLLALLALAVAAPQSAHAAAPSAKRCKAVKAKKHKTKRDRVTLTACRKAEAKAKAAKKKAASQAATSKPAATTAPALEAAVPTTSTPAPGATPTPIPTPTPTPAPTVPQIPAGSGRAVQVRGFEFGLNLSRTQVLPGSVRVEFNLASAEDPHTLILFREDGTGETYSFDEQPSGSVLAKSLQLSAGTWRLVCDLPEHAERGMQSTLRVG